MKLDLQQLIADLQKLQEKGATYVRIEGTLIAPQDGNLIIASTEKQY